MSNKPKEPEGRSWLERLFHHSPESKRDIIEVLRQAVTDKILDPETFTMIEGVLYVGDKQVRDVMVPRGQMVVIEERQSPTEFLPIIMESAHSRFPVMGNDNEEVIGIILAKDLLQYAFKHTKEPFSFQKILRPAYFVPESKRLDTLLKEFRSSRNHLAVVVDEYGGISGLVTIEDVLEEIVGDIEDETDKRTTQIKKIAQHHYHVDAATEIEDFNEFFETEYTDNEVDTIGGMITLRLGHVPKTGDKLKLEGFVFTVLEAQERRVISIEVQTPVGFSEDAD